MVMKPFAIGMCILLPMLAVYAPAQQAGSSKAGSSKAGKAPAGASTASGGTAALDSMFGGPVAEGAAGEAQVLQRDYMRTMFAFHRARRAKMEKAGKAPTSFSITQPVPVIEKFAPRFMKAAAKYAGTDDALPFLDWCLFIDRTPGNQTTRTALDALISKHLDSRATADTVARFARLRAALGDDFDKTLAKIVDATSHEEVRAAALFARAEAATQQKNPTEKVRAAAIADYKAALKLAPKAKFADTARGALFGATSLQVGMKAPDIVGEDLDGEAFKLSDYAGKVVMLSFWGDW